MSDLQEVMTQRLRAGCSDAWGTLLALASVLAGLQLRPRPLQPHITAGVAGVAPHCTDRETEAQALEPNPRPQGLRAALQAEPFLTVLPQGWPCLSYLLLLEPRRPLSESVHLPQVGGDCGRRHPGTHDSSQAHPHILLTCIGTTWLLLSETKLGVAVVMEHPRACRRQVWLHQVAQGCDQNMVSLPVSIWAFFSGRCLQMAARTAQGSSAQILKPRSSSPAAVPQPQSQGHVIQ